MNPWFYVAAFVGSGILSAVVVQGSIWRARGSGRAEGPAGLHVVRLAQREGEGAHEGADDRAGSGHDDDFFRGREGSWPPEPRQRARRTSGNY